LKKHAIRAELAGQVETVERRKAIDGVLRTLGYEGTAPNEKRRGRRPRQQEGGGSSATTGEVGKLNGSVTSKDAMSALSRPE